MAPGSRMEISFKQIQQPNIDLGVKNFPKFYQVCPQRPTIDREESQLLQSVPIASLEELGYFFCR